MENKDFNFEKFLRGFAVKVETKKEVTDKYVKGLIDKDEFIRRMNNARD